MKCPISNFGLHPSTTGERLSPADCLREECAWWEEHFGKCAIAVEAHLKGVADHRLEVKESQRDRY